MWWSRRCSTLIPDGFDSILWVILFLSQITTRPVDPTTRAERASDLPDKENITTLYKMQASQI